MFFSLFFGLAIDDGYPAAGRSAGRMHRPGGLARECAGAGALTGVAGGDERCAGSIRTAQV